MSKFCSYEYFKERVQEKIFMVNDSVVQYIKRHNIWKEIKDVVGDIVSEYHMARKSKCINCGGIIYSMLDVQLCSTCRKGESVC